MERPVLGALSFGVFAMPIMRARQSHGWKDSQVAEGDEYEATESEARLLEALQWAARTNKVNGQTTTRRRSRGSYQTRVSTAE